jgi:hypothetical protein
MGRVVDKEKLREDIQDRFKSLHKRAITNKARVEFIMTVSHMIPSNDDKKAGLEGIGFKSLKHFIEDCEGLHLKAQEFMNLAFAFDRYLNHAYEVVNHLVNVEGWADIVPMIPGGLGDKCGPKLREKGKYERKGKKDKSIIDNIKYKEEKGGTSKSYTLKKLARDSETDPKVAEMYKQVKQKVISANQAAIALGWRPKTITVRKDVESAAKSLRRLFDADELAALKNAL